MCVEVKSGEEKSYLFVLFVIWLAALQLPVVEYSDLECALQKKIFSTHCHDYLVFIFDLVFTHFMGSIQFRVETGHHIIHRKREGFVLVITWHHFKSLLIFILTFLMFLLPMYCEN